MRRGSSGVRLVLWSLLVVLPTFGIPGGVLAASPGGIDDPLIQLGPGMTAPPPASARPGQNPGTPRTRPAGRPATRVVPSAPATDPEAARLRSAAATGGPAEEHALAVYLLARAGEGDQAVEGLRWLAATAAQGYGPAQVDLGRLHRDGKGVKKNDLEAVRWFRRAADGGYLPGCIELGRLYAEGRGVHQDLVEAYVLLAVASSALHVAPATDYAEARALLVELPGRLSPEARVLAGARLAEARDGALDALMRRHPGRSPGAGEKTKTAPASKR